jgi:hypothetical protein
VGRLSIVTVVAPVSLGVTRALSHRLLQTDAGVVAIGGEVMQDMVFVSMVVERPAGQGDPSQPEPEEGVNVDPRTTGNARRPVSVSSGSMVLRDLLDEVFPVETPRESIPGPSGTDHLADVPTDVGRDSLREARGLISGPIPFEDLRIAIGGYTIWVSWQIVDSRGRGAAPGATVLMPDAVAPIIRALQDRFAEHEVPPDSMPQLTVTYNRAKRASHREARGRLKIMAAHPDLDAKTPAERAQAMTAWCARAQRHARFNLTHLVEQHRVARATPHRDPETTSPRTADRSQLLNGDAEDPIENGAPTSVINVRVSWQEPWLGWPSGADG